MQVQLLESRVAIVDGRVRSQQVGDIVDVSDAEAKRLITKRRAIAVETENKSTSATKKSKSK